MESLIKLIYFILFLSLANFSVGQEEMTPKIYETFLKTYVGKKDIGFLLAVRQDTLILAERAKKTKKNYHHPINISGIRIVPSQNIKSIKIRRRDAVIKSLFTGMAIGVGTGVLVALIEGDDDPGFLSYSKEDKMYLYGTGIGIASTALGLALGLTTKKELIKTDGDKTLFLLNQKKLNEYSIETQFNLTEQEISELMKN